MDQLTSNIPFLVFFVIGTVAVASSVLVVAMRTPVHSALFFLLSFICVAVLFMMKEAEFVATVQVLVYAGGIMVLFLFVIMLINVRHLPDEKMVSPLWLGGIGVRAAVLILFISLLPPGTYHDPGGKDDRLRIAYEHPGNRVHQPDRKVVRPPVPRGTE